MKLFQRVVLASAVVFLSPVLSYTQDLSAPLAQVVKTSVQECISSKAMKLPIITWGGDMATIYANGNQANTSKGSILDKQGVGLKLSRQDDFAKQLGDYLSCNTPYLRGTVGMVNMAAELINKDPRTAPKIIYQLTWSAGGDAMIVKEGIHSPKDLKGKTVAVQAYGPHVDYLAKIIADAGLSQRTLKFDGQRILPEATRAQQ